MGGGDPDPPPSSIQRCLLLGCLSGNTVLHRNCQIVKGAAVHVRMAAGWVVAGTTAATLFLLRVSARVGGGGARNVSSLVPLTPGGLQAQAALLHLSQPPKDTLVDRVLRAVVQLLLGSGAAGATAYRAGVAQGLVDIIGNTPLVRIKSLSEQTGCEVGSAGSRRLVAWC